MKGKQLCQTHWIFQMDSFLKNTSFFQNDFSTTQSNLYRWISVKSDKTYYAQKYILIQNSSLKKHNMNLIIL